VASSLVTLAYSRDQYSFSREYHGPENRSEENRDDGRSVKEKEREEEDTRSKEDESNR